MLGYEEGKEKEYLTNILGQLNIDSSTLSNLTSAFTDKEGVDQLVQALQNPAELQDLLKQKTGMDNIDINKFVNNVRSFR